MTRSFRSNARLASATVLLALVGLSLALPGTDELGPPLCTQPDDHCQLPDQLGHGGASIVAILSDAAVGAAAMDNFAIDADSVIASVCWWGTYTDAGTPCDDGDVPDAFTITYYPNSPGFPSEPDLTSGTSFAVAASKVATGRMIGDLVEYEYTATHPDLPVTTGECLWIEIVNDTTGGSCRWLWETAPPGDGLSFAGVFPNDFDLAFCLDVPLGDLAACELAVDPLCLGATGDCCQVSSTPGCNDPECCTLVCAASSFCCNVEWDAVCVQIALDVGCLGCCPTSGGACCLELGDCIETDEACCALFGGVYGGDGSTCVSDPCPTGACCLPTGVCEQLTAGECFQACGVFNGAGVCCGGGLEPGLGLGPGGGFCSKFVACTPPQEGACCLPDGGCTVTTEDSCICLNGLFTPNAECFVCPPTPVGACCLLDGTCEFGQTEEDCDLLGGVYRGHGTNCVFNGCDIGKCCLPDGTCAEIPESQCSAVGGDYAGDLTECDPFGDPCPPGGPCCLPGGNCQIVTTDTCNASGGTPEASCADCDPPSGACCVEDPKVIERELVLCLDVSGSINHTELALEIEGLKACLADPSLPQDGTQRVAIVVYGLTAAMALAELTPLTPANRVNVLEPALDGLLSNRLVGANATNIGAGLSLSRSILEGSQSLTPNDFIMIVGDGQGNVGPYVPAECNATALAGIVVCAIAVGAPPSGQQELQSCALATGGVFDTASSFQQFLPVCQQCFEFVVSGTCTLLPEEVCGRNNGVFQGNGEACAPDPCITCPWDCGDFDGFVGTADFLALLGQWGQFGSTCDLGIGGFGVDTQEFLALLAAWGPCP